MSMNIFLEAVVPVTIHYNNGKDEESTMTQRCNLLWQTPTEVTRKILTSEDKLEEYFKWVRSISEDEEEDLEGDVFDSETMTYNVIGTKIVNYGEEHIKDVRHWVNDYNNWNLEWSEI